MVRGSGADVGESEIHVASVSGCGIAVLLTVMVIGFAVQSRLRSDNIRRIFHFDELITLRYYTWAGVQPDGEIRRLRREADIEKLSRPGAREFLIGTYCAAGRWPEPNNHVIHSLLCNLSLAGLSVSRMSLRLPALLGAAVFAASMAGICWVAFRRTAPAVLAAAAAICLPYVVYYSQTARGYTWMMALCGLHGLLFLAVARRPDSIVYGTLCAGVAVASFMNVVNLIADWVVPVYATFIVFPGILIDKSEGAAGSRMRLIRRNLVIQMLAVAAVAAVFFIDRLPYVYSSARQYGLPFDGMHGFAQRVIEAVAVLFPTWGWQMAAAAGAMGAVYAWRWRALRGPVAMVLVSIGTSLAHFALTGRFAYERNWGFALPLVVIGWAALAQGLGNLWPSKTGRLISSGLISAAAAVLLLQAERVVLADVPLERFSTVVHNLGSCSQPATIALRNAGVTEPIELSIPEEWAVPADPLPERGRVAVCTLLKRSDDGAWRMRCGPTAGGETSGWLPGTWPAVACDQVQDEYRASVLHGEVVPDWPASEGTAALVFWYPPLEAVSVSPGPVTEPLAKWGGRYITIQQRYQAKLEIFGRLGCVLFPVEGSEEREAVRRIVSTLETTFGGMTRIVVPTENRNSAHKREAGRRDVRN